MCPKQGVSAARAEAAGTLAKGAACRRGDCIGVGPDQAEFLEDARDSFRAGKDFPVRNERIFRSTRKTRPLEWRGTCGTHSWGREGSLTHETPIRFVGLAARVPRLRSGRLCGGCRASRRRRRCPRAVHLGRSRLLRGRVLPRLSRAWVLRASSPLLAVVAARSVGRRSHGGARSPGRRRFFPINPLCYSIFSRLTEL